MDKDTRITNIVKDFENGIHIMSNFQQKAITIFGSARLKENTEEYKKTVEISKKISDSLNLNIITGGGPGIMEAANKGAHLSGNSESIGMGIILPFENIEGNSFTTVNEKFKYFFSRKVMLINYSVAFIAMKGGFGTLDEIFEVLTLMQTGKIKKSNIYLFGSDFYNPLIDFIKKSLLKNKVINEKDLDLLIVTDDVDFIINDLKNKI